MPTVRLTYQPAAPGAPVVLDVEPGGVVQVDATALLQITNASPTSGTATAAAQLALNGKQVPLHGDLRVELIDTAPPVGVRFGYNARPGPAALEATLGRPEVWRHFSPGAPDARAWEPGLPVITSFKLPPVDVAAGKHDATIRAFLKAKPTGLWAGVCLWHEPEDNVRNGEFTAAAWRAAQTRLNQLCHEVPNCVHMPILMEWTLNPASGRNVAEFTEGFPFDVIGWDVYPTLDATDRATKLGRVKATSARLGKPWAVCETGLPVMSPDGPRAQWMAAWAAELRAAGPVAVTWFITDMADPSPDYSLRSPETQAAMRAIIAA